MYSGIILLLEVPYVCSLLFWAALIRIECNYRVWYNIPYYNQFSQNDSYKTTINDYQVRIISKIRNVIFGLCNGKPSSALRPKLGCSTSWVLDEIQIFWGNHCLNNKNSWPTLLQRKYEAI